jgi:hypothetical protein
VSKTFVYERFDAETYTDRWGTLVIPVAASDGVYVMAEDAINREAVLQARIRTLETQLKDARQDALHWKANHDAQVARARVLIERTDLPLERVAAYRSLTQGG